MKPTFSHPLPLLGLALALAACEAPAPPTPSTGISTTPTPPPRPVTPAKTATPPVSLPSPLAKPATADALKALAKSDNAFATDPTRRARAEEGQPRDVALQHLQRAGHDPGRGQGRHRC